jgi:hypothetical protein
LCTGGSSGAKGEGSVRVGLHLELVGERNGLIPSEVIKRRINTAKQQTRRVVFGTTVTNDMEHDVT